MKPAAAKAMTYFNNGLNCAQTVLSAFCEKYGLGTEEAYRLATGFGAGMRCGEVCGAVSGAVLVIGLKYGQKTWDDLSAKAACYKKTEEFIDAFRRTNGSVICRDLMGLDVSTEEGLKTAKENGYFNTVCVEKIKCAIDLLENKGY